jgi:spermidine/putrescine transport system ATP-binding protein
MNIIELKNVTKMYGDKIAVDDFNLSIKKGEFVTFLGPSGCGKTTTLRMIAGFETVTNGEILMNGKSIKDIPPHLRPINTVFQRYALFPHMNVYENIAFGLRMKRIEKQIVDKKGRTKTVKEKLASSVIDEKVRNALKIVDMEDYDKRSVDSLSGGQMQRVAIARAIVNEPDVLLLDEPLGALDLKMRQEMQLELKTMHRKLGITFVYVTHDQEEALTMSDTIVVMNNGEIMQVGTPEKIYNEPVNAFVADFIGESNVLEGYMVEDGKVSLAGQVFDCDYEGFTLNCPVDIVLRPEDIRVYKSGKGQLEGKVISSIFKGIHYEMGIVCDDIEFLVQNTTERKVGEDVSLSIPASSIHIMLRELTNELDVEFISDEELSFAGSTFPFKSSKTELTGRSGKVSVAMDKIEILEDPDSAPLSAYIVESIFKGENYLVEVKTDSDDVLRISSPYLWNPDDHIGISIAPEDFKIIKLEDNNDEV